MDIAEIRKKAKANKKQDDASVEVAKEQDPTHEPESFDIAEPLDMVVSEEAAEVFAAPADLTQEASDALDRLFAVNDEFSLAIDGSEAGLLGDQGDARSAANRQYLSFHLSDEEYALDITLINEIIKVREFTEIPRSPGYILGIISLRGVVVPIFDLRRRLNLGTSELLLSSRIVVCSHEDVTVGLLVDSINQVVNLIDEDVEPPPGVLSGLDREMITGIGRCQGRMVILLNLHSVLAVETS